MTTQTGSPTHIAPAGATELGHDMAYRPGNQPRPDADRWECRSCGRIAYQAAGDMWGTATAVQCIDNVSIKEG